MTSLVLLPGMDGTGRFFADFVDALGSRAGCIVGSYPPDPTLGYAELEVVARSFLPTTQPFVLLGESFSGPIAISIAAARPTNLIGVILCCTFARVSRPRFGALDRLLRWLPAVSPPPALAEWFLLGRFSSARFKYALHQVLRDVPAAVLRARFRAVLSVDVTDKLAHLDVPVLYLRAAEDRLVPRHAAELIRQVYPPCVIQDFVAPHGLLQTVPHEAATAIMRFVQDCGRSRPGDAGHS
jgi:pimeloyl-[acyl-carrier protein] methyl ester esterase